MDGAGGTPRGPDPPPGPPVEEGRKTTPSGEPAVGIGQIDMSVAIRRGAGEEAPPSPRYPLHPGVDGRPSAHAPLRTLPIRLLIGTPLRGPPDWPRAGR